MTSTPDPQPVDPNEEPPAMRPSATGLVIPDTEEDGESERGGAARPTGEAQAQENAENDPPA